MPLAEFKGHKLFWERNRWGQESELLALLIKYFLQSKNSKKLDFEAPDIKDWAYLGSCRRKPKIKDGQAMRDAFMLMAKTIGREVKPDVSS